MWPLKKKAIEKKCEEPKWLAIAKQEFMFLASDVEEKVRALNQKHFTSGGFKLFQRPGGRIVYMLSYNQTEINPWFFEEISQTVLTYLEGQSASEIINFTESLKNELLKKITINS